MNGNNCKTTCWLVALTAGWLIGLYFWVGVEWGFFWSLVAGVIVFVLGGVFLPRFFCTQDDAQGNEAMSSSTSSSASSTSSGAAAAQRAPEKAAPLEPAPEPAAAPEPASTPEPAAPPQAETTTSESIVKPSTALPGQTELTARKGEWKYQGETSEATKQSSEPQASAPKVEAPEVAQAEGTQPQGLAAARAGGADNLKMIKGVGPKLESLLNSMGFYHFDQIGGWTAADVAWVDEHLIGFKGRVSRDSWVDQAKALAAGEETEFAKRAKKDGIYD